ncbi:MAG: DUF5640 domain-containing protein [Oscillospiraceae bacterium]|jgi:hypothetical protein
MKKWILAILTVILLLLSGCKTAPPSKSDSIAGVWKDTCGLTEYRFHADGTMKMKVLNLGSFRGTYNIQGSEITIEYKIMVKNVKDVYSFQLDGDTLYLNKQKFLRKE